MAENKFLDDLAKFGNTTLSAMTGAQRQVSKWVREQVDVLIENMELATRKDIESYKKKVADLEERIAKLEGKKPAKAPRKKAN